MNTTRDQKYHIPYGLIIINRLFWYFSVQQMVEGAYTFFSFFCPDFVPVKYLQDKLENFLNYFKE